MKKYGVRSLLAFFCLFLVVFINADGGPVKKIALIIGNGAYKANTLKNPPNDAADISSSLTSLGFRVTKLINADKRRMQEAIRDFGRELMKDWNTMGIFYYAGHGCNVKGTNYLIPVGAEIKAEDEVEYQAVDVGFVLSKMESAGNRVNILVLDACRDNPFSSSRSANRGLTVVEAPKGSLVVYATAPGSVAADGKGRNGVFTSAFLKNLEESPDMDIELFMRNVRKDVMAQTGNEQVPWTSSSLTESVAFKAGSLTEKSVTRPQTDNSITEAPENKTETTPKKEDTTVSTTKTEENPQLKASFDFILEYKGHTYYMSKQTATWNEAKEICEKNGGHLVTITSTEENEAIITCLKAKKINKDVWIGYTDSREERNWEWITGEESSFTYWAKNEPNNFNNTNEDYAQIWISTNPLRIWLYHWNDARQSSWSLFILEIE